jgi:flagellar biosynthesis protein FliQ
LVLVALVLIYLVSALVVVALLSLVQEPPQMQEQSL